MSQITKVNGVYTLLQNARLTNVVAGVNPLDAVNKAQLDALQQGTIDVTRVELASSGTAAAPAITWDGDTDTGLYRIGANNIGVSANGAKVLDIGTSGLTVVGTVAITGSGLTAATGGVTMYAGFFPTAAGQALSDAGAVNVTAYYTAWTTTGAAAATMAAGTHIGQRKKIKMVVDGGDGTLTPTSLSGGTTITFNDVGDYVEMIWNGSNWFVIENFGCTIA